MKLGQVQAWVHDPYTHTSNFDSANIFLRLLPGGQMVQTLRKQSLAPVCFRMKLGQVQAWVHDSFTHASNFDSTHIFLRLLPGGPDGPDPKEAVGTDGGHQGGARTVPCIRL